MLIWYKFCRWIDFLHTSGREILRGINRLESLGGQQQQQAVGPVGTAGRCFVVCEREVIATLVVLFS